MLFINICKLKSSNCSRFYGSLALAFNANEFSKIHKKYEHENLTGLFDNQELKNPTGLITMRYKAENDCNILMKEALSSCRTRKIVEILDDMSDSICGVADLSECMRLLHPNESVRRISLATSQTMSKLVENFNTNRELFNVLDDVVSKNMDVKSLDEADVRVGKLLHADFLASGINLDQYKRSKFVNETQKSIEFSSSFYEGTELSVNINASVLPKRLQDGLGLRSDQKIEVAHNYQLSDNSVLRETGYRIFYCNNPNQEELLRNLMESRFNVARFAGFSSFAERANIHLMCETPENVQNFLNRLSSRLLPFAEIDRLKILQKKYQKTLTLKDLYTDKYQILPWDVQYYTHSLKQAALQGGFESYSPYLSLGNCMEGINALLKSQFGVELTVEETIPGELWHPDVFKVTVRHRTMGHIGTVYCDMFTRPGKQTTDCHYTIRAGRQLYDGSYQNPIVVLHCNLTPVATDMSLAFLTPPLVETLFHEWGHAIHSLLARTRYQHVAGTRCTTDLAEAPSTLMEHFALDSRVLPEYARHHKTGAKLPDQMIDPVSRQRYLCSAIDHQSTIINSMFDLLVHGKEQPMATRSSSDIYQSISSNQSLLPGNKVFDRPADLGGIYWPQRFGHLVNYGAKYYAYLVSNCISGFLWRSGFHVDPWSGSTGERYRQAILQHGGERKPLEMISDFANSDHVTIDSLVDGFVEDMEANYSMK